MWYFRSPEIVFGPNALDHLTHLSGRRAFIVTDPMLTDLGYADLVQAKLGQAGIESQVYSQVGKEPTVAAVQRGAEAMADYQPDWVVGLGGGSALDAAKAMWILYEDPAIDLLSVSPFAPLQLRKKARLIAISATSGTGAEVSWGIVLTDPTERRKVTFGSPDNLPDLAIVDPQLARSMPPRLTADTGMDALTHAIEGYTSTWHNDFSDGLCLKAIQLIFAYLPRAVARGEEDEEAREKMHNAAAIAGLGFINAMCSLAHALGHSLGGLYAIPHGRAVGLFLPYTIQFVAKEERTRYRDIAALLGLTAATPAEGAASLVDAICHLSGQIGQPHSIRQALEISSTDFEETLDQLTEQAECDTQIVTAARMPSRDDIRNLFQYAYYGRSVDW